MIKKYEECHKKLELIPFMHENDNLKADEFIFIDHALLDRDSSKILRTVEMLALERQLFTQTKTRKVLTYNIAYQ